MVPAAKALRTKEERLYAIKLRTAQWQGAAGRGRSPLGSAAVCSYLRTIAGVSGARRSRKPS